jgi:hypothetical protein
MVNVVAPPNLVDILVIYQATFVATVCSRKVEIEQSETRFFSQNRYSITTPSIRKLSTITLNLMTLSIISLIAALKLKKSILQIPTNYNAQQK